MHRSLSITLQLVALLAALGCAATQVKQVLIDDAYEGGRPKNVLVIALVNQPTARRLMESEFVKRFKAQGVGAVESFQVLANDALEDEAARTSIIAAVTERAIDAVLMVRFAGSRTEERDIPGMTITRGYGMPYGSAGAWGGYTAVVGSFPGPSAPTTQGYSAEQRFLNLETRLYDVRTEKLIWSALSETRISGPAQEEIKPFVSRVCGALFGGKPFR